MDFVRLHPSDCEAVVHVILRYAHINTSRQFGDGDTAFDPQSVDVTQRCHSVVEVTQLLAIHEHTEPTSLAANLEL